MSHASPVRELAHWVVGTVVLALIVRTWLVLGLVVPVTVAGQSMEPAFEPGQRVLVDRTAYLLRRPARWDVVVFRSPVQGDRLCIKRVIGLPGETVAISDGDLWIDGELVREDVGVELRFEDLAAFRAQSGSPRGTPPTWSLGRDAYFVVGDNQAISDDSRSWWSRPGLPARLVVGRVLGGR